MDCLIVGFNELELEKNIANYEVMKKHTGAYRHLLHGVIQFQGEWMHYTDVFNTILSDAIDEPVHLHLMQLPNLAVCYLKSFLTRRGFDVDSINFYNVEKERFEERLRLKPTAVALTTTYYISEYPVVELVRHIRRISPDTKIIVGGPYISSICTSSDDYTSQDYILEKLEADIYINSPQGELTLSRVLDELRNGGGKGLGSVPNLIFRPALQAEPDGKSIETGDSQSPGSIQFIRTPLEMEDNDLNENRINWNLFPRKLYTPTAYMRSARGCPFECAFCNFPSIAGQLSYSDIDTIEKEMKQLHEAGVRYLTFIDDSFNVPKSRFKEILRMMISRNFKFHWFSYFRCSHADNETFDLMQESGCRGVFLGIESGDQEMLEHMNKKVKLEQYRAGIRKLHERGIFTFVSLIVGFPGETEKSVRSTIAFMEDAQPTFFKAELYFHAHHVPVHKKADQYGLRGSGYGWRHNTMDWQKACDNVERLYRTVEESQVCPVYMFDFWTIPYFLSKGISLEQIIRFLKLCRPLLLRNFDSLPPAGEEKYSRLLFALGKEIASNLEKVSMEPQVLYKSATEHGSLNDKSENASFKDAKSDELLQSLFRAAVMSSRETIKPRTTRGPVPLSASQQQMWFLNQLNPDSPAYNTYRAFYITGQLNQNIFKDSIEEIVRRHEALRTVFLLKDGIPLQVVQPDMGFDFSFTDLTGIDDVQRSSDEDRGADSYSGVNSMLSKILSAEARKIFDLLHGPCLRVSLFKLAETEHCFLLSMPHTVCDGWSLSVIFRELTALYEAFSQGQSSPLQKLAIQCSDYAAWEKEWLESEAINSHVDYWKQQLKGYPRSLNLPTDFSRPSFKNYRGACEPISLPKALTEQIKTFSSQEGATLFMTLLAAFQTLLFRYTGQEDIVVGSPIAGRNHPETHDIIGCFVNTSAFRTDLSGSPGFRDVLARVKKVTLDAFAHQDLPFQKVVEHVHEDSDVMLSPLFQVIFVLQNTPDVLREFSGLTFQSVNIDNKTAKLDLSLILEEYPGGLRGKLEYSTDLFKAGTIKSLISHFLVLLENIAVYPNRPVSQLPMLTKAEQHQILKECNNTMTKYPRDKCIHQLFDEQVDKSPDAIAIIFEDQQLTYRALNNKANQLAHYLMKQGVGPEVLVGICVERSLEMVIGILGILKAGGAYVPLDPAYPKDRLAFMLEDSGAPLLLTQYNLLENLHENKTEVLFLDQDREKIDLESSLTPATTTSAENLAYVIYTSGSTGRPKGISVIHRGVIRLIHAPNYVKISLEDVFLQFAPISFDASTFEIWGCLLNGARLIVFPSGTPSLEELGQAIQRYQVTVLWLTAALFHQMTEERLDDLKSVRQLLSGGDVLSVPHVRRFLQELKECTLINGYGPTENTTFTCCYRMTDPQQVANTVPIGRAVSNTQVYILDSRLQPVPIGVPGELHTGGDGLARGYLNRPDLNAEKFILNPFKEEPGALLYKTGDLCRYLPDGNIEFLGRIDHQIKVRGFRIEPQEIEAVLGQHTDVRETVVTVREDQPGDRYLVAYIVPERESAMITHELRLFLKEKLPDYMIPSVFVTLDLLPLTPNGKVDRRALPSPDSEQPEMAETYVEPCTPNETVIAGIWCEVLRLKNVGIHDNFFSLGGHSLLATQVMSRLQKIKRENLPLALLFQYPTVAGLAERLGRESDGEHEASQEFYTLFPIQTSGTRPPFFWFHSGLIRDFLPGFVGQDQPLYALMLQGFDGKRVQYNTTEEIVDHYLREIRAVQPSGPYFLGGFCWGARFAFEVANTLIRHGQNVALLFLVEPGLSSKAVHLDHNSSDVSTRWITSHLDTLEQLPLSRKISYVSEKFIGRCRWLKAGIKKLYIHLYREAHFRTGHLLPTSHRLDYAFDVISKARRNYIQGTYPNDILVIVGGEGSNSNAEWSNLAEGKVKIHVVPGAAHMDLIEGNKVGVWAKLLHTYLHRAQTNISDTKG